MAVEKSENALDAYVVSPESPESTEKVKSFWHIDKEMVRFKIHFFLYIGGLAASNPYIIVFANDNLGLSVSSLGTVLIAQMFVIIFTKPLICYIADYFNQLKAIICVLTILTATSYFLLFPIPKVERDQMVNSSALIMDNGFQGMNLCHRNKDILELTEDRIDFKLTETSDSNFMKTEDNSCILCTLDTETCLKKCVQITFNGCFFIIIKTKNDSSDFLDEKNNQKQNLALFCDPIDTFNFSLCFYHSKVSSRNYSDVNREIFCSHVIEMNESSHETNSSYVCSLLPENLRSTFASCTDKNALSEIKISEVRYISDFATYQFWAFAIIFSIGSICANAVFTLSDTACCETIQKTGADFGKQRVWGAIGWGVIAPLAGFINDYTQGFLASWILMGVMLLLFLWNISKLDLVKPNFSKNILGDVGTVLRSKEFLAFQAVIFLNGVGAGIVWFYLILFLTSIGGSKLLCGLCLTTQSFIGSIPFMFFSGWIIRKIGLFQVCMFSLFTYVIRFFWYSQLHNPWLAIPIEGTHGITYGLLYTALTSYGKQSSKPGTEATTQSIIFSTHEGLGCGLGCVLAGIGFDYLGSHRTFFILSVYYACGFVLSIILCFMIRRQKGKIQVTSLEQ
ncbi:major facilitator superfamily domain-containing protein 6 [Trichonephila clavata]|uniref:Major facilitator superfamily domain-containing protein 6 n=1 Tax=Trichonephila clavata TaxID=2740835 RepID=A0A8X6JDH0_TRICU|nr:major facilitator superfamily domain-containing protein 6 [Trichonephila clavata]